MNFDHALLNGSEVLYNYSDVFRSWQVLILRQKLLSFNQTNINHSETDEHTKTAVSEQVLSE